MIALNKVTFYCRQPDEQGIMHMFPVNSESKNHDTAKRWASEQKRTYDYEKKQWVYGEKHDPIVYEFENKGFENIKIDKLHYRGNGGRAYQIILEIDGDKFRMDMREDTLMDVINYKGIQAGGRLNGTFCFVRETSQINIILEGTEKHKKAIEERDKHKTHTKNIKKSDLKIGHIYSTLNGDSKVFLGHVYACDIDRDGEDKVSKPYKAMLFVGYSDFRKDNVKALLSEEDFTNFSESGHEKFYSWSFSIQKSHSFKVEGEKLDIPDLELVHERAREIGLANFKKYLDRDYCSLDDIKFSYILSKMQVDKNNLEYSLVDVIAMINKSDRRRWW